MPLKDAFRRQVELLIKVLPSVAREQCFALKGGTAITLFVTGNAGREAEAVGRCWAAVVKTRQNRACRT